MLENALKSALQASLGESYAEARFVIAVSGGRDSMALGSVASRILPYSRLVIAHFNHQLRGSDSDADEMLVREYFSRLGIRVAIGKGSGASSEESLRNERLEFLQQVAASEHCDWILTAHHLEDQLETFFMRLIRGSGLYGLKGMDRRRENFLKPLLHVSQERLREFATVEKIPFREDESNQSDRYFRNRVRHQLIPTIRNLSDPYGGYPKFLERFSGLIGEIQSETQLQEAQCTEWLASHCVATVFWSRLPRAQWEQCPLEFRRNLLRKLVWDSVKERLSRPRAEEALQQISDGQAGVPLPKDLILFQSCDYLYLQTPEQVTQLANPLPLVSKGKHWECEPIGLRVIDERGAGELRFTLPGDYFGKTKLKTLLLEARIPSFERPLLPVIARPNSSEVVWYFPQPNPPISIQEFGFPFSFKKR